MAAAAGALAQIYKFQHEGEFSDLRVSRRHSKRQDGSTSSRNGTRRGKTENQLPRSGSSNSSPEELQIDSDGAPSYLGSWTHESLFEHCQSLSHDNSGALTFTQVTELLKGTLKLSPEHVEEVLGELWVPDDPMKEEEEEDTVPEPDKGGEEDTNIYIAFGDLWIALLNLGVEPTTRENLRTKLLDLASSNDALVTLPLNLAYIFIFLVLVMGHLDVSERQRMESSLEAWVDGRDLEQMCTRNCDDINSFWEWLLGSQMGLEGIFQVWQTSSRGHKFWYLANRNILVADVKLGASDLQGNTQEEWLIHSTAGEAYLKTKNTTEPTDYLQAAKLAAVELGKRSLYKSQETRKIWLSFLTYNEDARMFAISKVKVVLRVTGVVEVWIKATAVGIDPYSPQYRYLILFDVLYCLLVLYVAVCELKDLCAHLMLGFNEFLDYWGFWNRVDWTCIIFGVTNIAIWISCTVLMGDPDLHSLLENSELNVDVMRLDSATVTTIMDKTDTLVLMLTVMHVMMALNTISIVLRFFKAFTSNARLRVVTDTFRRASADFAHFSIVFVTIFLPFAMIGHVLFGRDITQFRSFGSSVNTCLQVMMGDFGWYAEVSEDLWQFWGFLPSGMPIIVLILWYTFYMFFIVLVLLNMLLAIIIEHYTAVTKRHVKDSDPLWTQVMLFMKFKRDTRGHIPITTLCRDLDNDNDMAHPKPKVTVHTLMRAWPKMTMAQAVWLMSFVKDKKKLPAEDSSVERMLEDTHTLVEGISCSCEKIQADVLAAKVQSATPTNSPKLQEEKADRQLLLKVASRLEDLVENVAKLRRDQAGLARRVEEMGKTTVKALSRPDPQPMAEQAMHSLLEGSDSSKTESDDRRANPANDEVGSALNPERDKGGGRERRRQSGVGVKLKDKDKDRDKSRTRDRDRDRGKPAKE